VTRRAQAAIEFLVLFGFMLIVFTVFFLIIEQRSAQRQERAELAELAAIGAAVREEVALATRVHDGYNRTFLLPAAVSRGSYTLSLAPASLPTELAISDGQDEFVVFLPANLTAGSRLRPGHNRITRDDGLITIIDVPPPTPPECFADEDCGAGAVCVDQRCVACVDGDGDGYYSASSPPSCGAVDCDDGNQSIYPGAVEVCDDLVDNDCDDLIDAADGDCLVCQPWETGIVWLAGGASLTDPAAGISWDQRVDAGSDVCCNATTQCVANESAGGCVAHGFVSFPGATDRAWICANMTSVGLPAEGPELLRCTDDNDGALARNSTNGYCCSRFVTGPYAGTWGFNAGFQGGANKIENGSLAGACSDGSDNDCDGLRDGYDTACWSLLVNSTCGRNSTSENLTAYPNASMPSGARYAFDWRNASLAGGERSLAALHYTFDTPGDANSTRDYSVARQDGALRNGVQWGLTGRLGSGALSFDGIDDEVDVGTLAFINITDTFTIELWVLPQGARSGTSESDTGVSGTAGQRYALYPTHYGSGGSAGAGISVGTNGVSVFEHASGYMPSLLVYDTTLSDWTHVTVVYEDRKPSLYLNGQLVRTSPFTSTKTVHPGDKLGDGSSGYGPFLGRIDDARVFARALSAEQIATLYARGFDRLAKQELRLGDAWEVTLVASNGTHDSASVSSVPITVVKSELPCP